MKRSEKQVELFLDSGAFSAWTQKKPIDIYEYIDFIKLNQSSITVYANLDGIPMKGGTDKIMQNRLASAKLTLKNQRIMEKAGLNPLPCFHFGEPFEYLQYYVDNYDYLALGVAGNKGTTLIGWLNTCFQDYICDAAGMPKIKVHGFAVTSVKIMIAYPWYSVDSTSWAITGGMGSIFVPAFTRGVADYTKTPWKIFVSNRSPSMKEAGKNLSTLPPKEKDVYLSYIHSKGYVLGHSTFKQVDPNHELAENEKWAERKEKGQTTRLLEIIDEVGLCNTYQLRDELNIVYFHDFEKTRPEWPWAFQSINKGGLGL